MCDWKHNSPILYAQGLHPRIVADGFDIAKKEALRVLETLKLKRTIDRTTLIAVARTSLRTKLPQKTADLLTDVWSTECVDCIIDSLNC